LFDAELCKNRARLTRRKFGRESPTFAKAPTWQERLVVAGVTGLDIPVDFRWKVVAHWNRFEEFERALSARS
jgi:hypothetical protein